MDYSLSAEAQSYLLFVARGAILTHLGERAEIIDPDPEVSDEVNQPRGCFVTLHIGGRLRGCIGTFDDKTPLAENVRNMAKAAAADDPRFAPLTMDELDAAEIEISALTPFAPVASIDDIAIGRDGLVVIRGNRSGVLLPQVAEERGWSVEEFLANTCMKAGLPMDAWKADDVDVLSFRAEVFSEGGFVGGCGCGGC